MLSREPRFSYGRSIRGTNMKKLLLLGVALGWAGTGAAAYADDTPPPTPVAPAAPGAEAPAAPAAPAAPTSNAMTNPTLTGPLVANPNPAKFDSNSIFGPVYVTGVLSGLGFGESNHFATDHESYADISNGQVIVQNNSGPAQFYAQAGAYSIPSPRHLLCPGQPIEQPAVRPAAGGLGQVRLQ